MNREAPSAVSQKTSLCKHFFLTSKPYSYGAEVARCWCFAILLTGGSCLLAIPGIWALTTQTLLMWLYFNWQSDRLQKDSGRIIPPLILTAPAYLGATAAGAVVFGWRGLVAPIPYAFSVALYACKARYPWAGPRGPFFRFLSILAHFLMVTLTLGIIPSSADWLPATAFACWMAFRNLVGDVRDLNSDIHEFPVRYGRRVTLWACRLWVAAALICVTFSPLTPFAKGSTVAAMGLFFIAWEILASRLSDFSNAGYVAHRCLVSVTILVYFSSVLGYIPLWLVAFLFVAGSTLNATYSYLPGKRFPEIRDIFE